MVNWIQNLIKTNLKKKIGEKDDKDSEFVMNSVYNIWDNIPFDKEKLEQFSEKLSPFMNSRKVEYIEKI